MTFYETVFIVRPDVSAQHVDGMAGNFAAIIGDGGGTVSKTENWGLRSLAYRIKKNRKGHYVLMNIDAPSAAIGEMERNMRIDEDILRYLTIRVDALDDGPSVVMRVKAARDDRGRRDRDRDRDRDRGRGDAASRQDQAPSKANGDGAAPAARPAAEAKTSAAATSGSDKTDEPAAEAETSAAATSGSDKTDEPAAEAETSAAETSGSGKDEPAAEAETSGGDLRIRQD